MESYVKKKNLAYSLKNILFRLDLRLHGTIPTPIMAQSNKTFYKTLIFNHNYCDNEILQNSKSEIKIFILVLCAPLRFNFFSPTG
jgi:hypothetical protein